MWIGSAQTGLMIAPEPRTWRIAAGSLASIVFSLCSFLSAETESDFVNPHPDTEFKVFQFPRDAIPRIDGEIDDWGMVPDSYEYGTELLNDTEDGHGVSIDREDIDATVTLGWVKGMNRLYILYEAYDDFWDFERFNPHGYLNDIFEIVVDGDLSGGPFIFEPGKLPDDSRDRTSAEYIENHLSFAGYHAQNYHFYTPPVNNAWTLVWGSQPWIGEFPHSNYAYDYDFKHGESGRLVLECWITPYDYAPYGGPGQATETRFVEGESIGVSWSILDFDGEKRDGHYNLAHDTRMVKNATYLLPFRLMPIERALQPEIKAEWRFETLDLDKGVVAFKDESIGEIDSWKWDFGDGQESTEASPVVTLNKGVRKVITLEVSGAAGTSKRTRYWDVMVK